LLECDGVVVRGIPILVVAETGVHDGPSDCRAVIVSDIDETIAVADRRFGMLQPHAVAFAKERRQGR